jgi:clorobiocin biosynthesis protein CloN5
MGVDKELAMEERVHKTIRDYVVSTWLSGDERGFDDNTDLLQAGILDSFSTLNIAAFLDESFKMQLEPSEINPQNFRSVASLAAIVMAKSNS